MSLTSYRAAPPRDGEVAGPRASPGWRSTGASRGSAGLSPVMSLTSDPAAPPRAIGGRKAEDGRQIGPSSVFRRLCGKAWRRPTLPRLEAQYHWRRGFSRPSSGWDRVLCPSLWPPGPVHRTAEGEQRTDLSTVRLLPLSADRKRVVWGVLLKARFAASLMGPGPSLPRR